MVTSQEQLQNLTLTQRNLEQKSAETNVEIAQLGSRVTKLESPIESPEELDLFEENINTFYYTGTIAVANSVVTGTNTAFTELEVGDIFITTTSAGEDVEFRITNITDDTQLNVTPTNKTVTAGSRFRQSRELQLIKKVNDILRVMKGLEFII